MLKDTHAYSHKALHCDHTFVILQDSLSFEHCGPMPARFLEVTNPLEAARKSGSLTYMASHISWDNLNMPSLLPANGTTNSTLSRFANVAYKIHPPQGLAKTCLILGGAIYLLQAVLLHWVAKREVAAHGHAHRE